MCDWWFNVDCASTELLYPRAEDSGDGGLDGDGDGGSGYEGSGGGRAEEEVIIRGGAALDPGYGAPPAGHR